VESFSACSVLVRSQASCKAHTTLLFIRQLYSQAPSHSYHWYYRNHITPSSCCFYRRRSILASSDIFWSHQSASDCCSPSGSLRGWVLAEVEKKCHRTATKDVLFYCVIRHLVLPSCVTKHLWGIGRMWFLGQNGRA